MISMSASANSESMESGECPKSSGDVHMCSELYPECLDLYGHEVQYAVFGKLNSGLRYT